MKPNNIQQVENLEIIALEKVIYSGNVKVTGGRSGTAKNSDSQLDIILAPPGSKGHGCNPEQLFAAAWSACFIQTILSIGIQLNFSLPAEVSVNSSVDLATNRDGLFLQARMHINLPGISSVDAIKIVEQAQLACPYSRAVKNNINLQINNGV